MEIVFRGSCYAYSSVLHNIHRCALTQLIASNKCCFFFIFLFWEEDEEED